VMYVLSYDYCVGGSPHKLYWSALIEMRVELLCISIGHLGIFYFVMEENVKMCCLEILEMSFSILSLISKGVTPVHYHISQPLESYWKCRSDGNCACHPQSNKKLY